MWTGHRLDAAWTMRRAAQRVCSDSTIAALFLISVLESKAPAFLIEEAVRYVGTVDETVQDNLLLRTAKARFLMERGVNEPAQEALSELVRSTSCPIEAFSYYAEILLGSGDVSGGREILQRALYAAPNHPQLLSFIARTYLLPGESYNPSYAVQLATSACQETNWLSPREIHTLAFAYMAQNNRGAALIVAEKGRSVGSKLLGSYRDVRSIERLIAELSFSATAHQDS
jgi:predicted Zn-dependent protease